MAEMRAGSSLRSPRGGTRWQPAHGAGREARSATRGVPSPLPTRRSVPREWAGGLYDPPRPAFREAPRRVRAPAGAAPRAAAAAGDLRVAAGWAARSDHTPQPALFAVEYALASDVGVVGHRAQHRHGALGPASSSPPASQGVFSLGDAIRVIARRGRFMQVAACGRFHGSHRASEQQVTEALKPYAATVSIAAVNGPSQTVISGAAADVTRDLRSLHRGGRAHLPSRRVARFPFAARGAGARCVQREVATTRMMPPRLRLISNLTGRVASAEEVTAGALLAAPRARGRSVRRWAAYARELQPDCLIEAGPHPTLLSFASTVFGETGPQRIASCARVRRSGTLRSMRSRRCICSARRSNGAPYSAPADASSTSRPIRSSASAAGSRHVRRASRISGRETGHALLGARLRSAATSSCMTARISADSPAFVREHRDAAPRRSSGHGGNLDTLLACARDALKCDAVSVEDVTVEEAMLLSDDGAVRILQTICQPERDGVVAAAISSIAEDATERRSLDAACEREPAPRVHRISSTGDFETARKACAEVLDTQAFYSGFNARGLDFGPASVRCGSYVRGESAGTGPGRAGRTRWRQEQAAIRFIRCCSTAACRCSRRRSPTMMTRCCICPSGSSAPRRSPARWHRRAAGVTRSSPAEAARPGVRTFVFTTAAAHSSRELAECSSSPWRAMRWPGSASAGSTDCLYETRWRKAEGQDQAEAPCSPAELVRDLSATVPALAQSVSIRAYDTFLARLEGARASTSHRGTRCVGWMAAPSRGAVRDGHLRGSAESGSGACATVRAAAAILGRRRLAARGAAAGE